MTNLKNRTIAAAAAMIATLATVGAAAPLRAETVTRVVRYADLDLTTATGQAVMARRIRTAVNAVCGPVDVANRYVVRACRQRAAIDAKLHLAAVEYGARTIALASAR